MIGAIIPAAGTGSRMGMPVPKQFLELNGVPLLVRTIGIFLQVEKIQHIAVVLPGNHLDTAEQLLKKSFSAAQYRRLILVAGGATRQASVLAGFAALPAATEYILVHDGARPFVSTEIIENCLQEAMEHGAAVVGVPVRDTLKEVDATGSVLGTVDREKLWHAQTPQAVAAQLFRRAYEHADATGFMGTDEASLLEHAGIPVRMTEGSEQNIKITRPGDLELGGNLYGAVSMQRIGHGFDAHRLVGGRQLILGGVSLSHALGLEGHSDADVLTHAFMDALLGALGEGDIGGWFPDTDPAYRNISSLELLRQVMAMVWKKKYTLSNGDITLVCQRPKLAPYVPEMKDNLAAACQVESNRINIKATTTERMGFAGREEGIAAHAVVLLQGNGPSVSK